MKEAFAAIISKVREIDFKKSQDYGGHQDYTQPSVFSPYTPWFFSFMKAVTPALTDLKYPFLCQTRIQIYSLVDGLKTKVQMTVTTFSTTFPFTKRDFKQAVLHSNLDSTFPGGKKIMVFPVFQQILSQVLLNCLHLKSLTMALIFSVCLCPYSMQRVDLDKSKKGKQSTNKITKLQMAHQR